MRVAVASLIECREAAVDILVSLPPAHQKQLTDQLQLLNRRLYILARRRKLPKPYTTFLCKSDYRALAGMAGVPKDGAERRPPGRPKGSPTVNRTPGARVGRPKDPRAWKSKLRYHNAEDALRIKKWCERFGYILPASVKRSLGLPYTELEGRYELECMRANAELSPGQQPLYGPRPVGSPPLNSYNLLGESDDYFPPQIIDGQELIDGGTLSPEDQAAYDEQWGIPSTAEPIAPDPADTAPDPTTPDPTEAVEDGEAAARRRLLEGGE